MRPYPPVLWAAQRHGNTPYYWQRLWDLSEPIYLYARQHLTSSWVTEGQSFESLVLETPMFLTRVVSNLFIFLVPLPLSHKLHDRACSERSVAYALIQDLTNNSVCSEPHVTLPFVTILVAGFLDCSQ